MLHGDPKYPIVRARTLISSLLAFMMLSTSVNIGLMHRERERERVFTTNKGVLGICSMLMKE